MSNISPQNDQVSELRLEVETRENPDWPVVRVLIDGKDPFVESATGWGGFDPDDILGPASPLLPVDHGRLVAVFRCSCGEAGCGAIAPVIALSSDRRRVHWTGFGKYVGVFFRPLPTFDDPALAGAGVQEADLGLPVGLPNVCFDLDQYVNEVERASSDRSWETPRRRTARLLYGRLAPLNLALPTGLPLQAVVPHWDEDGYVIRFERVQDDGIIIGQIDLRLTSPYEDPEIAAADLVSQLLAVPLTKWHVAFGTVADLGPRPTMGRALQRGVFALSAAVRS